MPDWVNAQLFQWIANNGFAVVAFVLLLALVVGPLLLLLRYVIFDAVRYFTNRLDSMATQQTAAYNRIGDAIDRQTGAIDRQSALLGALAEGQRMAMMFLAHNQAEVVAHRVAVESPPPPGGEDVPAPITGIVKPVEQSDT